MSNAELVAELLHVSKAVPDTTGQLCPVLGDVSLQMRAGEIVVLTGGNGVGKTLALSLLVHHFHGTLRPDHGTIRFPALRSRSGLGYCPQDFVGTMAEDWSAIDEMAAPLSFRNDLTVRGVLSLAAGHATSTDKGFATDAMKRLGFALPVGRRASSLSTGQLQQVAIVRALVRSLAGEQQIVLLDEPLSNLQPDLQIAFLSRLRTLAAEHQLGILLVLHQLELALLVADRIVCFSERPVRWSDVDALRVPGIPGKPRSTADLESPEFVGLYKEIVRRLPVGSSVAL
jgi:ABC-type cobalamin/Fe3+-siderophores transport system ATPase subunit